MTSRRKTQGWQDPVRGYATYRAIQNWFVAQGLGGALASAGIFAALASIQLVHLLRCPKGEAV